MATVKQNRRKKPKQTDKQNEKGKYFFVECPNCRATIGEPCKWENGDVCRDRIQRYERRKADAGELRVKPKDPEGSDAVTQEDGSGTD